MRVCFVLVSWIEETFRIILKAIWSELVSRQHIQISGERELFCLFHAQGKLVGLKRSFPPPIPNKIKRKSVDLMIGNW
jgi:hypothetical protein